MPTGTDPARRGWSRRRFAGAIGALGGAWSWPAAARADGRLLATWAEGDAYRAGLLQWAGAALEVPASIELPTRGHGLLFDARQRALVVARRPGDWLLRWDPRTGHADWLWAEPGCAFNGHVVASADGRRLFTTETDLDTGAGRIGVRDARSLQKIAEWPTGGRDPHQLLVEGDTLWIANGGIPTQPETGRAKRDLHLMDSSLVRLHAARGEPLGRWQLDDPRLSLRHLARQGGRIGIALQAEHDDAARRAAAPLLAVLQAGVLSAVPGPIGVQGLGYAGDIAASDGGFLVSAPRAGCVLHWAASAAMTVHARWPEACALTPLGRHALVAGASGVSWLPDGASPARAIAWPTGRSANRLDNHAVAAPDGPTA